ncbi:hypothetical protein [Spiroplasma endosymbiont of Seladonia tumulorum]|uniref:hypothetical protein n=1 Tax=Spiroplasma endosymbiont of Seladonia tumulorum TaxID=3066321 RepID=UPI0030D5B713
MKKIFSLLTFIFLNGAVMPLIGAIQYDIREERDRIQQERDRRRQIKLEEEMKNYIAMINNVNLGVIRHNNKQSIFENLPKKYPRYANFTLKIKIPINNYDYSNEHYWAFVSFKSFTTRQNEDALTAKVIFNTEDNLSQKIKTILENQEIQNWVNDFRQFSDNVKFLIDTVISKLDYNAEILWVFNTIETLKTYLREFTNIINIIKIQLQLKKFIIENQILSKKLIN